MSTTSDSWKAKVKMQPRVYGEHFNFALRAVTNGQKHMVVPLVLYRRARRLIYSGPHV
jgi:hypothetical protein